MAKKLIDRKYLLSQDLASCASFIIEPDMILTPAAKDYLIERQVPIVYAKDCQTSSCQAEKQPKDCPSEQIVRILINEYGVNPSEVPELIKQILQRMS